MSVPDVRPRRRPVGPRAGGIRVRGLTREFRRQRRRPGLGGAVRGLFAPEYDVLTAVDRVSFRIEPGQIVGYIGPNGAGKSTTIKMLVGTLVPTAGEVSVGGMVPLPDYERTLTGFQEMLGIDEFADVAVRQLSLGQRMRDMGDIEKLCDRVIVIDKGRIMYDGGLDALKRRYAADSVIAADVRGTVRDRARLQAAGAKRVEAKGGAVTITFDPARTTAAAIIGELLRSNEVRDFSVILMKFNHIWFSNVIIGLIVLLVSLRELGISLGAADVIWLVVTLACGVMILSGLIIMIGTLSFRFIRAGSMGQRIFFTFAEFIRYPITIYPKAIQLLLTAVPFAFINFYPAHLFLDRSGGGTFAPALRYGGPAVAVVTLALGVALWNAGIRRYQSTGS